MKGSVVISTALKGGSRSGAAAIADYLEKDQNIEAECIEVRGAMSDDPREALLEMEEVAAGTQCEKFLYHYQVNPAEGVALSKQEYLDLIERTDKALGLEGHQRVLYRHVNEKGREHYHVVVNRVGLDEHGKLRAVNMGKDAETRLKVAVQWEKERGLDGLKRPSIDRSERGRRGPQDHEYQRAERYGEKSPAARYREIRTIYAQSKDGPDFQKRMKDAGYTLAKGTRKADVILAVSDSGGFRQSVVRIVRDKNQRKADIDKHLGGIDRAALPSVGEDERSGPSRRQDRQSPHADIYSKARDRLWAEYRQDQQRRGFGKVQWDELRDREKARREKIRTTYSSKSTAIRGARANGAERRAALSVVRMEKVIAQQQADELTRAERSQLKHDQAEQSRAGFKDFLAEKARAGDEQALSELRWRVRREEREPQETEFVVRPSVRELRNGPAPAPILRSLDYHVERTGDVIYHREGQAVLVDRRDRVDFKRLDNDTVETGLRLAQAKFGYTTTLHLTGPEAFKEKAARVVAEKGLNIEFDDGRLNKIVAERKAEIAAELQKTRGVGAGKAPAGGRSQAERPASQVKQEQPAELRELREKSLPANTTHGRYTGPVQGVDDRYVYQEWGRGRTVRHDRSQFKELPKRDEQIRVQYRNDTAQVERNLQEKQRDRGKGIGD